VPPAPEPADNPGTPEKIDLGRLLFYDPILSADKTVACATCHSEEWGMGDGMALSVGVGGIGPTGPGRTGPNVGRRNALTLWNAGHLTAMFWDGRAASLEDQVLGPLQNPKELALDPQAAAADVAAIPEYASRFAAAFPGATPSTMEGTPTPPAVTVENMQRAIAAFERTLVTDRAPYDQYVAGDPGALDADAQRGMFLFAKAGCAGCHEPPLFQRTLYADRGVAAVPGVADDGRFEVTHDPADRGAFRVPTLRNIRETGPYFHTGAVVTLDDAVHQEAALAPVPLADDEIAAIVAFLYKGLIDPSRSPNRPPSVPSGVPVPRDGFRIPR
jgi:cytochrome c peroxidase